ncbi:MAG: DUF4843 domain-containing protein [Prevotella sp.]|nr:DUF4843 domain-containing protein [Prevotella sp.]
MKKLLYLSLLLLVVVGCSKDDVDVYDEENAAVRFVTSGTSWPRVELEMGGISYSSNEWLLYNNFTFLDDPMATQHDYDIPLVLIGKTSSRDRKVGYSIEPETTAPEGSYEIVEAVIPADSLYGHIRVRVFNVEELSDSTYELRIRLTSSEDLAAGPKQYITDHFSWNNQITAPSNNNHIRTYNMLVAGMASFISTSMACYSPNALRAIVAATGWDDWDDYDVHGTQYNNATTYKSYKYLPRYSWIYSDQSYMGYAAKLRDWLKSYEEKNGSPLLHDAGNLKGKPVEARSY